MKVNWFYQVMGDIQGPIDDDEFQRLVACSDIQPGTFVRRSDQDWMTADQIQGMFPTPKREVQADQKDSFFIQVMGEVHGPVTAPGLRRMAAQNDINRDTFVRRNDEDWMTADKVQGLLK